MRRRPRAHPGSAQSSLRRLQQKQQAISFFIFYPPANHIIEYGIESGDYSRAKERRFLSRRRRLGKCLSLGTSWLRSATSASVDLGKRGPRDAEKVKRRDQPVRNRET